MEISSVGMPATNALSKLAETAFGAATKKTGAAADAGGAGGFADLIQQSLASVNSAQAASETTAQQYQLGQNGVSLEDAMISMQKANITFQTTLQVRNKLVSAYNDIMNMQV